jgi:hypothetical protein
MTRTDGKTSQVVTIPFCAFRSLPEDQALIIALTWTNTVRPRAMTLMQFSVPARRLHSL